MNVLSMLFGNSSAAVVGAVLRMVLPPKVGWIAPAVEAVWSAVGEIDDAVARGKVKHARVVAVVRDALDEIDGVPGWADLSEDARDRLLGGIAEICLFVLRTSKGKPVQSAGAVRFSDALRDVSLGIFAAIDLADDDMSLDLDTAPLRNLTQADTLRKRLAI